MNITLGLLVGSLGMGGALLALGMANIGTLVGVVFFVGIALGTVVPKEV